MTDADPPSFTAVAGALREAGSLAEAAEAHGSLCGLACFLGADAPRWWFADVLGLRDGAAPDPLSGLAGATVQALAAGELGFAPLLPDDGVALALRTGALADWCHGFTHGLAAGAALAGRADALDGAVPGEVLADFSELARAGLGVDESGNEAEAAYTELVEFVRVSAQLVFDELLHARAPAAGLH